MVVDRSGCVRVLCVRVCGGGGGSISHRLASFKQTRVFKAAFINSTGSVSRAVLKGFEGELRCTTRLHVYWSALTYTPGSFLDLSISYLDKECNNRRNLLPERSPSTCPIPARIHPSHPPPVNNTVFPLPAPSQANPRDDETGPCVYQELPCSHTINKHHIHCI